jgi:hypothetical protein
MAQVSNSLTGMDKRRFPRVRLQRSLAEVIAALGAQIVWPNQETGEILDLSYKGFAARRPGLFPIAVQERVDLKVELGTLPPFTVHGRIAWCNLEWVGVEVNELTAEGHLSMGTFLDAKLLGAGLRPVERAFYGEQQSFQYWFQGPQDTHVFVWMDSARAIQKVNVSMNGSPCDFERGQSFQSPSEHQQRALLVLSQMDKDTLPMEEFVRSLGAPSGV